MKVTMNIEETHISASLDITSQPSSHILDVSLGLCQEPQTFAVKIFIYLRSFINIKLVVVL